MSDKIPDGLVKHVALKAFCRLGKTPSKVELWDALQAIRAMIEAYPDIARLICEPGKWAVVPVEATAEMLRAVSIEADRCAALNYGAPLPHNEVWDAMLVAAQEPTP